MNLCSVSWEVIHMTSRAIRGLVPNLSGDNRCISSSHLAPFFFLLPSLVGNRSSETWPFKCVAIDKVTAQLYVCVQSVCMCLLLSSDVYTTKTKEDKDQLRHLFSLRSHSSELDLTRVDGCCPQVHALILDRSKALRRCSRSWRSGCTHQVYCEADRCVTQGTLWLCPLVLKRHQSLQWPLSFVVPQTVCVYVELC